MKNLSLLSLPELGAAQRRLESGAGLLPPWARHEQLVAIEKEIALREEEIERVSAHGWPGDGSGEDDFADLNANEADDYLPE